MKEKMLIDKISYTNPIKNINPGIKFTLSMMTLVFLLYTRSKEVFIFDLILFNLLLLFICSKSESERFTKAEFCSSFIYFINRNFIVANKGGYLDIFVTFIFVNISNLFPYLLDTSCRFGLYI